MHRPPLNWSQTATRHDAKTLTGRIFQGIQQLIQTRKRVPALHAQALTIPVWTHNEQVLGLIRESPRGRVLILANFSEQPQSLSRSHIAGMGLKGDLLNHLSGTTITHQPILQLEPYQVLWLQMSDRGDLPIKESV